MKDNAVACVSIHDLVYLKHSRRLLSPLGIDVSPDGDGTHRFSSM